MISKSVFHTEHLFWVYATSDRSLPQSWNRTGNSSKATPHWLKEQLQLKEDSAGGAICSRSICKGSASAYWLKQGDAISINTYFLLHRTSDLSSSTKRLAEWDINNASLATWSVMDCVIFSERYVRRVRPLDQTGAHTASNKPRWKYYEQSSYCPKASPNVRIQLEIARRFAQIAIKFIDSRREMRPANALLRAIRLYW